VIRSIGPADAEAVAALTASVELFPPDEAGVVKEALDAFFAGRSDDGPVWVVDEVDGELVGTAYYEPVTATDRTWELLMIGVRRDRHRQGRGTALLRHVEEDLRARSAATAGRDLGATGVRPGPRLLPRLRLRGGSTGARLLRSRR
jgi:GNAT superfamily N-acetyltransferase